MARFEVRDGAAFDIKRFHLDGLYNGTSYSREPAAYTIYFDTGTVNVLRGSGFVYDSLGNLAGGLVTSFQALIAGMTFALIKGISIPVSSLVAAAKTATRVDDMLLLRAEMAGADMMLGHNRDDRFEGMGGNDKILGRGGNDRLDGGAGDDLIVGGAGKDVMIGGAGKDRFRFEEISDSRVSAPDVVVDFERGRDRIDLRLIDANVYLSGDQSFSFIGEEHFSGSAGELRFYGGRVFGDVDGDGRADFAIRVSETTSLRSYDFIL